MTGGVPEAGQSGSPAARKLDGKATAAAIKAELAARVKALRAEGKAPGLGTVLVGEDPGSVSYVAGKHRDCAEVGTAYIVQLPLPRGVDQNAVLERIDPNKDADGLHPTNLGRLVLSVGGEIRSPLPCTPAGILELLSRHGVSLRGKNVAVVGRGVTVGRSIGLLLTRRGVDATVVNCHTGTANVEEIVRRADVVVAAAGVARLVTPEWIKPGAAVVDVGVSRIVDPETGKARIVGDVHPDVAEVAAWLSPNPGGVGPMTRAMLLANVVDIAERKPCA